MSDYGAKEALKLHVSPACEHEPTEELILTPSSSEEQSECLDLTLEADVIAKPEDITFDGEAESEIRIEEAMKAYDAAMDAAAGLE